MTVCGACLFVIQEMMYIWNGYTVIGKHKELTEGMLATLDEAQTALESSPSMQKHSLELAFWVPYYLFV